MHPSVEDPGVRALSEVVGGPIGPRAGRHWWWTPVRVVLAMTALCFALGMVKDTACYQAKWSDADVNYTHMCYSDLPYLYTGRGFVELHWPYADDDAVRARYTAMEYPVVISYWAWWSAKVTHVLSGSPDVEARAGVPADTLAGEPEVRKEMLRFVAVNAVGFAALALLAAWLLAGVHRGRPWDAAFFALSPALLLAGLVNWDMLAVTCVAAALWAWSRDRTVLTGAMIGLGVATKLFPLFLLGGILVICLRQRRFRELGEVYRRDGRDVAAAQRAGVRRRAGGLEDVLAVQLRPHRRPGLDLAGPRPAVRLVDDRVDDQPVVVAVLRSLVRRGPRDRPGRPGHAPAGPARLPRGRRLPARQQGLLAPVRAVAAARSPCSPGPGCATR